VTVRVDGADEVGRGPLSTAALAVYRALVLEVLLLLTLAPTIVVWTLLVPDPTNVWLYALSGLAIGPALSAGLYASRAWALERDQRPAAAFWRGYVRGFWPVLRWWTPALALAAILVLDVAFADHVPGGAALRPAAVLLLAVLTVVAGHLLVVTTFFSFRTLDAARIALYCLGRCPTASLGVLALVVAGVGLAVLGGDVLALLLLFAFVRLAHLNARSVLTLVTETFTRHA